MSILTVEQQAIKQAAKDFVAKYIIPNAVKFDKSGDFHPFLLEASKESKIFAMAVPKEYGGLNYDALTQALVLEEWGYGCAGMGTTLAASILSMDSVLVAGNDQQKRRYFTPMIGSEIGAFGLTEPGAGSDAGAGKTVAIKKGDEYILNGTKCWMSGVREADWYTVFAKTADPASRAHDSVTAFIVEREWPGVEVGRTDHKMGVRGIDTGELLLGDVRVPPTNVIGEVGGFRLAMLGLNSMRPVVAARGIGLAEGALMYATEYVKERAAFGKTIADFQGVQWEIAKCAVDIEAARLLTYRAAWLADQGKFTKQWVPYLSMAKYHATELAVRASGLAVQLLGAAGYMEDHPTEQWYRDAKQLTIVEGTSQVQLGLVARGVLDRDLWWD